MTHIALGIFSERQKAEAAISSLQSMGYNPKDISILMKDTREAKEIAETTGVSDIAEDTVTGAGTGAVAGGIAGFLAGTVLPGLGGFLVGGPIGAALGLSGVAATTVSGAATGAVAGGIIGALISSFGLSDEEAEMYQTRVQEGGILVAVPSRKGDEDEVRNTLEQFDAYDIKLVEGNASRGGSQKTSTSHKTGSHRNSDYVVQAKGNGNRNHDDDLANPIQVEKYLKGIDYPASKSELIDKAEREGADSRVLSTLERLPDKKFDKPTEVSKAIGQFM